MTGGVVRLTEIKIPVVLGEIKVKIYPHYFYFTPCWSDSRLTYQARHELGLAKCTFQFVC